MPEDVVEDVVGTGADAEVEDEQIEVGVHGVEDGHQQLVS